ncbi:AfsR/SARP family transcriptional regulator [Phytohabitans sp. ZYX-F-186]|uniref:AfsR/SARP family transcriptional regulator n=1 Tax=Phytohabitans maris TaxID=3071409 RepID=A0ABU0ZK42_9ACTN|nr:AfsR/SARP family transcriptional regulator [Phytohabitans sp. ZYX-F-186]MDQ7907405.1 AfsR/SARP family transcriptional regulator [Phytohabitans sp. ZYX-F-186]
MNFNVLGTFEVVHNGVVSSPTAPKVCQVLALLLLADQPVPRESLIEELWVDRPPRSAVTTCQTYIYQIRKYLAEMGAPRDGMDVLSTHPSGYVLRARRPDVDARRFEDLVEGARAVAAEDPVGAARMVRRALRTWRGAPLSNLILGPLLRVHVSHLEEQYLRAWEICIELEMRMGRHRELIGELKTLAAMHPFKEWFHGQLMLALHRSGRRVEALNVYQKLHRILREELGLGPSLEIRQLHQQILSGVEEQTAGQVQLQGLRGA